MGLNINQHDTGGLKILFPNKTNQKQKLNNNIINHVSRDVLESRGNYLSELGILCIVLITPKQIVNLELSSTLLHKRPLLTAVRSLLVKCTLNTRENNTVWSLLSKLRNRKGGAELSKR